jgi:hypothetical protein
VATEKERKIMSRFIAVDRDRAKLEALQKQAQE